MKKPQEPRKPKKPQEPVKRVKHAGVQQSLNLFESINLKHFLDDHGITNFDPEKLVIVIDDVTMNSGWYHDTPDISAWVEYREEYYTEIPDDEFEKRTKIYNRKLKKYEERMEVYLEKKAKYDKDMKEYEKQRKLKQLQKLKKELGV